MASRSFTPIVSRLEVNLSWKAWLKPFFIHPSVTAGAADNMSLVRDLKSRREPEKKEEVAKTDLSGRVLKLLTKLTNYLDSGSGHQAAILLLIASKDSEDEYRVSKAWEIIHSVANPDQSVHLRTLFKQLEMDEYTLYIEIASQINKSLRVFEPSLDSVFSGQFRTHERLIDCVDTFVGKIQDEILKTSLQKLLTAYHSQKKEGGVNPPRAENSKQKENPKKKEDPQVAVTSYVHDSHILQGSFLKTFGFDGLESTSTELVDAQGEQYSYDQRFEGYSSYPTIPFSLALMTFLGFPARLHDGKANLGVREIVRNAFGGWDSLNNGKSKKWDWWLHLKNYTFEGKRLWNVILLPIKLVIFAFKLSTFLLKFALNVLKLVTEFLPEVILNYSGVFLGLCLSSVPRQYYLNQDGPWYTKIMPGIVLSLLLILSAPVHYAARLLVLVGTALTSPEKLARMAWNYGRALNSRWGYIFGFIGAAISVALTASLWAIIFPLVFAKALALIPALAPIVTSIAQLPIIASTLAYINGAAVLVAGTVPAAFSLAATVISTAFGVTVSAMTLAVATTVAIIVAPVASVASRLMDGLSNVWTKWKADSPLLFNIRAQINYKPLGNSVQESVLESVLASLRSSCGPSGQVTKLTDESDVNLDEAKTAADSADKHAEAKPYQAQIPKKPAPAIDYEKPCPLLGSVITDSSLSYREF